MAYDNSGLITVKAEADIAEAIMVKQGAAIGGAVVTAAATDINLGVTTDSALSGQSVAVKNTGIVRVTMGAAVTLGDPLKMTTAGKLITWIIGTDVIVAQAMDNATADGEIISVFLTSK